MSSPDSLAPSVCARARSDGEQIARATSCASEATAQSCVRLTGGEALVRALKAAGIRDVFGVAGGSFVNLMRAVANDADLRYIGTRHEAAGGFMAAGTFAATGRLAVCLGEQGPGSLNLLSSLGHAFNNNLALVAVTSSPPTTFSRPFRGLFMEWDAQNAFRANTKHSVQVNAAARVPQLVREIIKAALSGRPGPVHIDMPSDVMFESADFDTRELDASPLSYLPAGRTAAEKNSVERAAELLARATRPLVVAGGGIARAQATPELRQVISRLQALATTTQMGLGAVDSGSPDFIGHGGVIGGPALMRAMREADVVLVVGCRFSSWMWDGHAPAVHGSRGQRVVQIDIDPMMLGRLMPVDVVIAGDAKAVLAQLLDALGEPVRSKPDAAWRSSIVDEYRHYRGGIEQVASESHDPMHPATLAKELGEWLPDDALVVYDGGHTTFWSNELTPVRATNTRFHDPGMAHLGFGTPYALALKHAFPERTIVNTIGDGAFGFTLQELDTARRYRLNVITVVHNNASFGVIQAGQRRNGFELGTELGGTDYVAIARAFGCYAERVDRREQIKPALERALQSGLPAVIDAHVSFEDFPSIDAFHRMATAPKRGQL